MTTYCNSKLFLLVDGFETDYWEILAWCRDNLPTDKWEEKNETITQEGGDGGGRFSRLVYIKFHHLEDFMLYKLTWECDVYST